MSLLFLLTACGGGPQPHDGQHSTDPTGTCPTGEVLDGETCVPEACGVGTWGDLPVDGDTVYVAAGGTGDGTVEQPLGSIQAALDLAGEQGGGLVAVAAGRYLETLSMGKDHDGVTLAGRCRELVTIDGSEGEEVPAVEVVGENGRRPEVQIQGVTVTGGRYVGVWVQEAAVVVDGVDVAENTHSGVVAAEADVVLTGVGVFDTRPDGRGDFGRGIDVEAGATDDAPPGWAELLRRGFGVDGWACPDGGKRMRLRTVGVGSPASATIVTGLLPSTGPPAPRRGGDDQGVHAGA